jgi:sugar (pentulose or hexulose) kinase
VSDILDVPIEYSPQSGGALGIACLAGYATGCFSDLSTIRDRWLDQPEMTTPHPEARALYDRLYGVYCALDEELGPQMARLAPDG